MGNTGFIIRLSSTALAGLCLASCAPHLSQQQCLSMNWQQMGLTDGSQGKVQRNLQPFIVDCAKFDIPVNTSAYHKGWRAGVRQFCLPPVAYRLGTNGQTYNNVCPSDLAPAFNHSWRRGLRRYCTPQTGYNLGRSGQAYPDFCAPGQAVAFRNAYDSGRRIYSSIQNIQSEINNVNSRIADIHHRVRQKNKNIYHWLQEKTDPHATAATRRLARHSIEQDKRDIQDLNHQLDQLHRHRDFLQRQFNRQNGRP